MDSTRSPKFIWPKWEGGLASKIPIGVNGLPSAAGAPR